MSGVTVSLLAVVCTLCLIKMLDNRTVDADNIAREQYDLENIKMLKKECEIYGSLSYACEEAGSASKPKHYRINIEDEENYNIGDLRETPGICDCIGNYDCDCERQDPSAYYYQGPSEQKTQEQIEHPQAKPHVIFKPQPPYKLKLKNKGSTVPRNYKVDDCDSLL